MFIYIYIYSDMKNFLPGTQKPIWSVQLLLKSNNLGYLQIVNSRWIHGALCCAYIWSESLPFIDKYI